MPLTYAGAMAAVEHRVLNEDVGGAWLDSHAVVACGGEVSRRYWTAEPMVVLMRSIVEAATIAVGKRQTWYQQVSNVNNHLHPPFDMLTLRMTTPLQ